jgi:hypothetical protein
LCAEFKEKMKCELQPPSGWAPHPVPLYAHVLRVYLLPKQRLADE